jgi:hypothetical protein
MQQPQDVPALLRQITEHQETYRLLYQRNVLLYNELMHAKATIEHLSPKETQYFQESNL